MRRTVVLLVLATLAATFLGCSGGAAEDTIKIGVAGPMTGPQARNGEELWLGALLASLQGTAQSKTLQR